MKTIKRLLSAVAVCSALMLASCQEPDYTITITATPDNLVSPLYEAQTITYTVTSATGAAQVEVQSTPNIEVHMLSAANSLTGKLLLSMTENAPEGESYVTISAKNEGASESIQIFVEQEIIRLEESAVEVGIDGGDINIAVNTNVDFVAVIPENAASWLKSVETKTVEPHTLVLHAERNELVNRETVVTVKSSNTDVYAKIAIKQEGPLHNLVITYAETVVVAPELGGSNPGGTIDWGDGKTNPYVTGAQHGYNDNKSTHTVQIMTAAESFTFYKLTNVKGINLSDF